MFLYDAYRFKIFYFYAVMRNIVKFMCCFCVALTFNSNMAPTIGKLRISPSKYDQRVLYISDLSRVKAGINWALSNKEISVYWLIFITCTRYLIG